MKYLFAVLLFSFVGCSQAVPSYPVRNSDTVQPGDCFTSFYNSRLQLQAINIGGFILHDTNEKIVELDSLHLLNKEDNCVKYYDQVKEANLFKQLKSLSDRITKLEKSK